MLALLMGHWVAVFEQEGQLCSKKLHLATAAKSSRVLFMKFASVWSWSLAVKEVTGASHLHWMWSLELITCSWSGHWSWWLALNLVTRACHLLLIWSLELVTCSWSGHWTWSLALNLVTVSLSSNDTEQVPEAFMSKVNWCPQAKWTDVRSRDKQLEIFVSLLTLYCVWVETFTATTNVGWYEVHSGVSDNWLAVQVCGNRGGDPLQGNDSKEWNKVLLWSCDLVLLWSCALVILCSSFKYQWVEGLAVHWTFSVPCTRGPSVSVPWSTSVCK
jgi:hypothetical protein